MTLTKPIVTRHSREVGGAIPAPAPLFVEMRTGNAPCPLSVTWGGQRLYPDRSI